MSTNSSTTTVGPALGLLSLLQPWIKLKMPRYGLGRMLLRDWRPASCVVASLILIALATAFSEFDLGAVVCVGIALVSAAALVVLVVPAVVKKRQRTFTSTALAVYQA